MVLGADCGGLTAGWRGWKGGGRNGVESGVGEGGGRAPAWVRDGGESYLSLVSAP
jgi:hypothetical protein